jgi:hypothetical protein
MLITHSYVTANNHPDYDAVKYTSEDGLVLWNGAGIVIGNGIIDNSSIIGDDTGIGLKITGYAGYNTGGVFTLSNSIIQNTETGIYLREYNLYYNHSSFTMDNNNLLNNTYHIKNLWEIDITASNNF